MKTKLLIFGITGDLAQRKLLPALTQIVASGAVGDIEIIGVSRQKTKLANVVPKELVKITKVLTMDLAKLSDYKTLKQQLNVGKTEQLVIYLSVPPLAATRIADNLGAAKLNGKNVKILFEKPFGIDLESSKTMVERTSRYFKEDQIYRIDHFLAKGMAQNIISFRASNAIFRQVWNNKSIESVEILAVEKIGIEGRASFYEQTGALRDVLQGHLMQLLSLVLMDIPANFNWEDLPDLRLQALKRIESANTAKVIRAQYVGYQKEVKNSGSQTETFVKAELRSDLAAWEGVPLILATGKALSSKLTEIRVYFKASSIKQTNCLRFIIQPNESVEIDLYTKKPGYERDFEKQKLIFNYPENTTLPDAYEQVIVDAIRSNKSLFTSSSEIIESWRVLQPLLDSWSMDDKLQTYAKGSSIEEINIG